MRRELILHAGTHKTASTYIQARLKRNRDRLSAHGIFYAFPEGDTTFKRLSKAIGNRRLQARGQVMKWCLISPAYLF